MKRVKPFLAFLLSVLLMTSYPVNASTVTVHLQPQCLIVGFDSDAAENSYIRVEGTMIYYENGISEELVAQAVSAYMKIPYEMLVKLVSINCNIYLTTYSEMDGSVTLGQAHALEYSYRNDSMEITNVLDYPYIICRTASSNIERTILHEVGHIFDTSIATLENGYYSGGGYTISNTEEWISIYETDGAAIMTLDSSVATNFYDYAEGFASTFYFAIEKPEELIAVSPAAYEFIYRMIAQYCVE